MKKWSMLCILISGLLGGCKACNAEKTPMVNSLQPPVKQAMLYPWLAKNGKFGYIDSSGKLVIAPQYDDAKLFLGGYAVVGKNGAYGVIDEKNKQIIALKYPSVRLFTADGFCLVITKREYSARQNFWHWKLWPEFNILGGNSGPTLVTKVPMAEWRIRSLPSKQIVFSRSQLDTRDSWGTTQYWKKDWVPERSVPSDIKISSTSQPDLLAVQQLVFRKDQRTGRKGRLRIISRKFNGFTKQGQLLVKNGDGYKVVGENGKSVVGQDATDKVSLHRTDVLSFKTTAHETVLLHQKDQRMNYNLIAGDIYTNRRGEFFLSPDFKMPFPATIQDYQNKNDKETHYSAKEIMTTIGLLSPMVGKDAYLVIAAPGKFGASGGGTACFILHQDGSWEQNIPIYKGADKMMTDGRISFDRSTLTGVLDTGLVFYPMPLRNIAVCAQNHYWYMGKDTLTKKYGVYDARLQRWQVPPAFDYLQEEISANISIYSTLKTDSAGNQKEWFGLINLKENKEITGAIYDHIFSDGRVKRTIDGKQLVFYINIITGDEYRMLTSHR